MFYNAEASGYWGRRITLYNDLSSDTDANFAIYRLNADGTIGERLVSWKKDIHPGNSKSVHLIDQFNPTAIDMVVRVKNDGWSWQHNKIITGRVVFNE